MRYIDAIFLGKKVRCDFNYNYDAIAIPDYNPISLWISRCALNYNRRFHVT